MGYEFTRSLLIKGVDVPICKEWAGDYVFDYYWRIISAGIILTYLALAKILIAKFIKSIGFANLNL